MCETDAWKRPRAPAQAAQATSTRPGRPGHLPVTNQAALRAPPRGRPPGRPHPARRQKPQQSKYATPKSDFSAPFRGRRVGSAAPHPGSPRLTGGPSGGGFSPLPKPSDEYPPRYGRKTSKNAGCRKIVSRMCETDAWKRSTNVHPPARRSSGTRGVRRARPAPRSSRAEPSQVVKAVEAITSNIVLIIFKYVNFCTSPRAWPTGRLLSHQQSLRNVCRWSQVGDYHA
ncbi:unnamed protein product [Macrosiphum euphorbiae]|uniref:Uncharacterized protein n=1 Tax=Macrosiphum euphorbiae TaxID=13131 RepID=A0AAV0X7Q1_9HEMI|nr:unnamed protein product [Macrosiphum euphorbiae]